MLVFGGVISTSHAAWAMTDQGQLLKATERLLSSLDKPGKGLRACMSDAMGPAVKRVGGITASNLMASPANVAVRCVIGEYDSNGARLPGPPVACSTWVPLGR
jgi:hypothetical protein